MLTCGVVCGLARRPLQPRCCCGSASRAIARGRRWRSRGRSPSRRVCGLALAVVGAVSGGLVFGTGYEETHAILTGGEEHAGFGFAKLAATLISYLSGIPGGIFAPSLAVGAGLGHDIARLFPEQPAGALLLLGMGSYFSGVVQAPLTAFVIVLEMTQNAELALPLMAATLIAHAVSRTVCPRPLYKQLARGFKTPH